MRDSIDLSRFKVIHGERVVRAVSLLVMEFSDDTDHTETVVKPKFIDILVINSDGNLEILHDEAWTFQFVPILGEKSMTEKWVLCPICGGKTRTKIRPDTEAKNLIVFCPKCKRETVMDIKDMESKAVE